MKTKTKEWLPELPRNANERDKKIEEYDRLYGHHSMCWCCGGFRPPIDLSKPHWGGNYNCDFNLPESGCRMIMSGDEECRFMDQKN